MELELKRSVLKVNIYGKSYELKKLTVGQYEAFTKSIKKDMGESEALEGMRGILVLAGLPSEVLTDLEMDHLSELIQYVSGSKKK